MISTLPLLILTAIFTKQSVRPFAKRFYRFNIILVKIGSIMLSFYRGTQALLTLSKISQVVKSGFWNQTHFCLALKQRLLTSLLVCSHFTYGNFYIQVALTALKDL